MRIALRITLAVLALLPLLGAPVNPDSAIIQDFEKRVADYVQLRKTEESKLTRLHATASSEKISQYQHALAKAIMQARQSARQGDIFTPQVDKEFRRLMGFAMQREDAPRIKKSLQDAEPVAGQPQVNHPYPSGTPVQSTPPSILLNLPHLPPDIEYRFVSRTLILLDSKANLIIDFMTNVGP
jgi:hypothetical protein